MGLIFSLKKHIGRSTHAPSTIWGLWSIFFYFIFLLNVHMSPPAVRTAAERVKLKHDSKLTINNNNPHQFFNSGKHKHVV